MNYQKDREVFNIGGFRGIDTENPQDKVATFRATSGKNFQIDANSLKTRPALINDVVYAVDGNIVGIFKWNNLDVVLTINDTNQKSRVYIISEDNTIYTDGIETNVNELIFTNIQQFFFEGVKPFFVPEKECLFIFCVNEIFVLSKVNNGDNYAYVVYSIGKKLPHDTTGFSAYCSIERYNDLPFAYIPTVQIGEKFFEDINLLSNKRKYQLFGGQGENTYNEYYLLGDYSPEKNGAFEDLDIHCEFYGQDIENISSIPVFLGVEGETIDYETETGFYWVFPNASSTPSIIETLEFTFSSTEVWEFLDTDVYLENPLKQNAGLKKETALNFFLSSGVTIFEYLRGIDLSDYESVIDGKDIVFAIKLNIEIVYTIKNSSGVAISYGNHAIIQRKIYFGFYNLQPSTLFKLLTENYYKFSPFITNSAVFPSSYTPLRLETMQPEDIFVDVLPVTGETEIAYYKNSETNTIYLWSATISDFSQICFDYPITITAEYGADLTVEQRETVVDWFNVNNDLPIDINEAQIRVKTLKTDVIPGIRTHDIGSFNDLPLKDDTVNFKKTTIYTDNYSFFGASYPGWNDPLDRLGGHTVNVSYSAESLTRFYVGGMYTGLFNAIKTAITSYINEQELSTGTYVFYIDIDEIDKNNGLFETGVKYTMRVNVGVTATADTMAYTHTLHILHVNRSAGGTRRFFEVILTDDGLKARVINLLINYKNEPAINLTIGFADNTYNYSLIAKSQFGTTFGAENRVFLAGNPSFKHVDRYNISNDLLGNNQKSQSYELSYFPSKNYRVVGGDYSAINGYVVATDTQLYVTKEFAINDSCLYIRTREINDSGVVSFFEYKTNINKTPINNRCIVNFYNDVVMLTKDGLLAIEISSNVLTNERLLKLRSGFINGQLKADIKETPMPFCIEDNERLYMVIGKNIYVADARYVDTNENSKIDNVSYEIVKWQVGVSLYNAFNSENGIVFYDTSRKYYLQNTGYDKLYYIFKEGEIVFGWEIIDGTPEDVFINENVYNYLHDNDLLEINTENYCYIKAIDGNDISWSAGSGLVQFSVSVDNIAQIENLTENVISELDIYVYTDNGFEIITDFSGDLINVIGATVLYGIVIDWKNKPLYIWKEDVPGEIKLKLRPFDKEKIADGIEETQASVILYVDETSDSSYYYTISSPIEVEWFSGVLDFGNKLYEKTMFSLSFYVKTDELSGYFNYGYRTLRGHKAFTDLHAMQRGNLMTLENSDFNLFSLTTFSQSVISHRKKENNFLYIQFVFNGKGNIEISDFLVYYKNNRKNKIIS